MKRNLGTAQVGPAVEFLSRLLPQDREALEREGKRCRLGARLIFEAIKPSHSSEQQGYYWQSLHAFGKWLGYEADEVESLLHPAVCAQTWGVKGHREIHCQGQSYQWPVPNETSSKDADGKKRDWESYGELIESLTRFAAEYGYAVPPPKRKRA